MHVLLDENLPYRLRQLFENSIEQDLRKRHLGRKRTASDSASETVKREVAEARGPRRTDACCVSPIEGCHSWVSGLERETEWGAPANSCNRV